MLSASVEVCASSGMETKPYELVTEKPSPLLAQRLRDPQRHACLIHRAHREHAELVAAEAVGGVAGADRVGEPSAEAGQQRVARGMPERVVVGLEAVEIEQDEQRLRAAQGVQVGQQLPAVAEPGERVGRRLDLAQPQHLQVLPEDEHHPHDHRGDAGGREHEREQMDAVEVVVDERGEPDRPERRGKHEGAPAPDEPSRGDALRLPDGQRHDHRRERPARVDEAADVRPVRDHEEVDRVADREDGEPERESRPAAAQLPARDGHRSDDEREQRQVADRIREVGGDRELRAAGRVDDRAERDRGADAGHGERGNRAVEHGRRAAAAGALLGENDDSCKGWEVEEDPALRRRARGTASGRRSTARPSSRGLRKPRKPVQRR